MRQQANKKQRDVEFTVGELVLVKLQPYRQSSVAKRLNPKLSRRYFGSFPIITRIGVVAYNLGLPPSSRIHPSFHVSLLKKYYGNPPQQCYPLPKLAVANNPLMLPTTILSSRIITKQVHPTKEVFVQWSLSAPEEAN